MEAKRDLSLDLKNIFRHPLGSNQTAPSLITPTLNLTTPELSKMISEEELAILTPNGISSVIPQSNVLPSPLIPTTVNCNNMINCNNNNLQNSNKCNSMDNHANQNPNRKKRPDKGREMDMDKIEKKRERNRLAAKKCRQRKEETIEELRKTVSDWELKFQRLEMALEECSNQKNREIELLRRENADLRNQLASRRR